VKKTLRSIKNFFLHKNKYLFEKELFKKAEIGYVPDKLNIHITFRCNLRCPTCLFLLKDPHIFDKERDMTMEQFLWVLDKFNGKINGFHFGGGESLMHPQIYEMAKEVKKRGIWLGISTNGILIKKRIGALKLFDRINISLDGTDYEDFKKIRNGTPAQYRDILEGINLLKAQGINFHTSFLLFEETLARVPKIMEFVRSIGSNMLVFRAGNPRGHNKWTALMAESPKVQAFLKDILSRNDYPFSIRMPEICEDNELFPTYKCPKTWQTVYVHWNGDIGQCCYNKPDPALGNIFKGYNLNSPTMVKLRQATIDNKYPIDCKYCCKRFKEAYWGYFSKKTKQWNFSPNYKKMLKEYEIV